MRANRIMLWCKSAAVIARHLTQAAAPSLPFESWSKIPSSPRDAVTMDIPALLFAEVAKGHHCVAEIGASNGGRMLAVKAARPEIDAYAFDIRPEYTETPELVGGVNFIQYRPDFLKVIPEITLVLSVYTMTCMAPRELDDFLSSLKTRKASLCFFEPEPIVSISEPVCRKRDSWYHPYPALAKRHGFTPTIKERWKHFGNSKIIERTHYDCWV